MKEKVESGADGGLGISELEFLIAGADDSSGEALAGVLRISALKYR